MIRCLWLKKIGFQKRTPRSTSLFVPFLFYSIILYLSLPVSAFFCISLCLFSLLLPFLSFSVSLFLSVCLSIFLSFCLSVFLLSCLSVFLFFSSSLHQFPTFFLPQLSLSLSPLFQFFLVYSLNPFFSFPNVSSLSLQS
jgi:hypothetical protein